MAGTTLLVSLPQRHWSLALEFGTESLAGVRKCITQFQEDCEVFLSARDPSSAAIAYQSMKKLWLKLSRFPVYDKILTGDQRANALIPYLRDHSDKINEMLTPGTELNAAYCNWMEKLSCFLEEFFSLHQEY